MTSLIGTSVLLIAGSALALVFGWVTADESLIWTSIGASVASGVVLALAYGRARQELRRPARPAPATADGTTSAEAVKKTAAASSVTTVRPVPAKAVDVEPSPSAPEKADIEPSPPVPQKAADVETAAPVPKEAAHVEPSRSVPKKVPPAKPRTVPKKVPAVTPLPAPKKPVVADVPAAPRKPASRGKVVAVPHTKRFHKPTCRYAATKNAVEITKTSALTRGFDACGICKP